MKVLYVAHGNFWGSTWPYAFIDQFIVNALKQLGHEVKVFDVFTRVQTVYPFFKEYAQKNNLNKNQLFSILYDRAGADLPLEVLEFEPDLVLHIVGQLNKRVLQALKDLKVKTAIWFLDDPQEVDFTSKKSLNYDYVFTVESACVDAYKKAGSNNAYFLPLGCDPLIDKKIDKLEKKYISDICFIGVAFPARVEFFDGVADFLKDYNVKIIGGGKTIGSANDPWLWKKKLKKAKLLDKFILDEVVAPGEAAKYYNGAKICLNIHRAAIDQRASKGNKDKIMPEAVSGRTFEIAGCGAFQLIDDARSNVSKHFKVGEEIVTFSDQEDFKKKVRYYLDNSKEREAIAQAGQKRAYAEHTYKQRIEYLLSKCN
jgi:spore maturation protein CgeB